MSFECGRRSWWVRVAGLGVACVGLAGAIASCSSAGGSNTNPGHGSGGSSGGSTGGSSGAGGSGGLGLGGGGGASGFGGIDSDGSGGAGGQSCASVSAEAKPSAANVLILLDLSGSMNDVIPFPLGTRYSLTNGAFQQVVPNLPDNLRMGLVYFGHPKNVPGCTASDPGCCTRDSANGGPDIPILLLDPTQKQAIQGWMNTNGPDNANNTPTKSALDGAYDILKNSGLDGDYYVLMLTDGAENCGGDPAATVQDAKTAATGSPSVKTFVVGSPGSDAYRQTLSDIALNGGTARVPGCTGAAGNTCHYDLSSSSNFQADLTAALTSILGNVKVACEYAIPAPDGGTIDPNKVNVEYYAGGNPPAQDIYNVSDASQCSSGGNNGGWYYDDNQTPTKIELCPGTCSAVQADPAAKVDVAFGCQTKVKPVN